MGKSMVAEQPLFKHDCEHCVFLGTYQDHYDLYFCAQGSGSQLPTVIARVGNEPSEYASGIGTALPYLLEAERRAIARGLLKLKAGDPRLAPKRRIAEELARLVVKYVLEEQLPGTHIVPDHTLGEHYETWKIETAEVAEENPRAVVLRMMSDEGHRKTATIEVCVVAEGEG